MAYEQDKLQPHPAAELFLMMTDAELEKLAADIKERGLGEPIVVHDGMILDGRNRLEACRRAGHEPEFIDWNGEGDPVAFVLSKNLRRRHLNGPQRAMAGARLANMRQGARTDLSSIDEMSQETAARLMQIGKSSVERAVTVLKKGVPKIIDAVDRGKFPVSTAAAIAELPEKDREKVVAEPVTKWREAFRDVMREREADERSDEPPAKRAKSRRTQSREPVTPPPTEAGHAQTGEPADVGPSPTTEPANIEKPDTQDTTGIGAQPVEAANASAAEAAPPSSTYELIVENLCALNKARSAVARAGGIGNVVADRSEDDQRGLTELLAGVRNMLTTWIKQLPQGDATDDD